MSASPQTEGLAMSPIDALHPDVQRLSEFGLGRLEEAEALQIEQHLVDCAACRETLETLPGDSFVALVRAAEVPAATPLPSEAATLVYPNGESGEFALPPELANHSKYRVLELLGVGGMGAVFKAEHLRMERTVALKMINRNLLDNPATVERFRREVKAAARLTHPNIVHAYDADQEGDLHFLIMEYVEGVSLAKLVEQKGPLSVNQASDFIRQAALGLQHIHEGGMVHRDIKPHNLMVAKPVTGGKPSAGLVSGEVVKLLDCGLARFALESGPSLAQTATLEALQAVTLPENPPAPNALTQIGTVMGTPDYIAPEQARDAHSAEIRADIYSLGCTLYDLLAGHAPFPEGTVVQKIISHLERSPKSLREVRSELPPGLVRVVEKMMAKDPARRYQTPVQVAEALEPFTKYIPPPFGRSWRGFFIRAGMLLALLLLITWFYGPMLLPEVQKLVQSWNQGTVEIEASQKVLHVTIIAADSRSHHLDVLAGSKATYWLDPGEVKITLMEYFPLRIKTAKVQITRGETLVLKAEEFFALPDLEPPLSKDGLDPETQKVASVQGKYSVLLKKIEEAKDEGAYGKFNDYGYYSGLTWGEHKNLPKGYWVYVTPHWYIWEKSKVPSPQEGQPNPPPPGKLQPPAELPAEEALKKAAVNGKYLELLKKIKVSEDFPLYGAFTDSGFSPTSEYGGHKNLPTGYWVYVYPHWYIWKEVDPDKLVPGVNDVAILQGKWLPVAGESGGKAIQEEMLKQITSVEFKDDKMSFTQGGKTQSGTILLNFSKTPSWIDLKRSEGVNKFAFLEGIYEVGGGTLKLCIGEPEDPRPTAFITQPGTKTLFLTLKRAKAASD